MSMLEAQWSHYLSHLVWLWAYLWLNSESVFLLQWFLSDAGFGKLTVNEKALPTKMMTSPGNCLPVWLSVTSHVCLFVPEPLSWVLACWQGTWRAGWSASAVARHLPCTAGQWLPPTWFLTSIRPLRTFSIDCTGSKNFVYTDLHCSAVVAQA